MRSNVHLMERSIRNPKKHNRNFCTDCNMEMLIDYQKSTLVCRNCGLFEYFPVYIASYNDMMQPLRKKCVYKRSESFKVILISSLMVKSCLFQMMLWIH